MYCANTAKARLEIENMTLKKNDIADHLNAAIKDGDASAFPPALGDAVQAFGMEEVCDATGYTRGKISRATHAAAQPRFETVHNIVRGMGLRIRFVATNHGQTREIRYFSDEKE
jgi:probable addiction module antidote protein